LKLLDRVNQRFYPEWKEMMAYRRDIQDQVNAYFEERKAKGLGYDPKHFHQFLKEVGAIKPLGSLYHIDDFQHDSTDPRLLISSPQCVGGKGQFFTKPAFGDHRNAMYGTVRNRATTQMITPQGDIQVLNSNIIPETEGGGDSFRWAV